MPRPQNKDSLLSLSETNFGKLLAFIDSIDDKNRLFAFEDRDRNIRDVLVHLHEWHKLLIDWVESNLAGHDKRFLPDGYNWKNYGEMNVSFRDKHAETCFEDALNWLMSSHASVMKLIAARGEEELFEKKYHAWTGTTSLGSYCVSATSSHYEWALKKLKKAAKAWKDSETTKP